MMSADCEEKIARLRHALKNARAMLTAFGGDTSSLTEAQASGVGADMMQWELLLQIDESLRLSL